MKWKQNGGMACGHQDGKSQPLKQGSYHAVCLENENECEVIWKYMEGGVDKNRAKGLGLKSGQATQNEIEGLVEWIMAQG